MPKSAFDFEGGEEYGDFYGLGADLVEDGAPASEKAPAFNALWNRKYKGKKDWEGKKYTAKDKAKARKALNAGWRDQKSGALDGVGFGSGFGPVLFAGVALVAWLVFREKK